MQILTSAISEYLHSLAPHRSSVLQGMEADAEQRGFPIVGPLVGSVLAQLAALIGARRVLELGSGFGYSALWFTSVMPRDGRIICTDGDAANAARAHAAFVEEGREEMLDFRVGDALTLLTDVSGPFDIIFCDIDKHEYPDAYEAALPLLHDGGLLIFDNALWSGRMLEGDDAASTTGVAELNRRAASDSRVHAVWIPLRDGVLVCRKLAGEVPAE